MSSDNLIQQPQTREAIEFLSMAATQLATAKDVQTLAQSLSRIILSSVSAEYIGLYFIEPATGQLTLPVAIGFSPEEQAEALRTAMERHPGTVLRTGQIMNVSDVQVDSLQQTRDSRRSFVVRSRLWMPVQCEGRNIGAIGMASSARAHFTELHQSVLGFACHIAGVIYKNIEDSQELVRQLATVRRQEEELRQLSSPVIEVWSRVLALPLIGYIDGGRFALICDNLLTAIVERRAQAVILDLTGVDSVDQAATERLGRLCRSVELLGSRALMSGICPDMAASMAKLGVDLGSVRTFSTLKQALAFAIRVQDEPRDSKKLHKKE